eukprot:CAMPEP_0197629346 /NCGR_PEP_ID=MMETSP1338-20131121/7235_1 /TAXON_ID=43686 ORGANISM="Pelagodinium beii, Strain RCC1491" /NCGR_SAMPLE_ID=MMETSP1338 /ASSEMBLY_ACC=CAM_ASM_000754 /LENGTH=581 /DNA_ID=CAMNT_0043200379 /DNA_START=67 /DNA_END=1812 /DNA_ORIENTATION=-
MALLLAFFIQCIVIVAKNVDHTKKHIMRAQALINDQGQAVEEVEVNNITTKVYPLPTPCGNCGDCTGCAFTQYFDKYKPGEAGSRAGCHGCIGPLRVNKTMCEAAGMFLGGQGLWCPPLTFDTADKPVNTTGPNGYYPPNLTALKAEKIVNTNVSIYWLAASPTQKCMGQVTTEADCKEAQEKLGGLWGGVASKIDNCFGCVWSRKEKTVQFNPNLNARCGNQEMVAICRRSVDPKVVPPELLSHQAVVETEKYGQCSSLGDPHVYTFDCRANGDKKWDAIYAPGHWWMVKTKDKSVMIQATYGACGSKNGTGRQKWMSDRAKGIPPTCVLSVGVSGSFLGGQVLGIRPPCDWDWENERCANSPDRNGWPIITLDGKPMKLAKRMSFDGVELDVAEWAVIAKLSEHGHMHLLMKGKGWAGIANNYIDFNVKMHQRKGTVQCGHCGNFDGSCDDDREMYDIHGQLKQDQDVFCKPDVTCNELFVKEGTLCRENTPGGAALTLADCPADEKAAAKVRCETAFSAKDVTPSQGQMDICMEDVCLGTAAFADDDADEFRKVKEDEGDLTSSLTSNMEASNSEEKP